jgi:acetyltransferase
MVAVNSGYPKQVETVVALLSGEPLRVRSVCRDDEHRLAEMAGSMTPEDLRPRFFTAHRPLSAASLAQLARLDSMQDVILVAEAAKTNEFLGAAVSRTDADNRDAEFAVIVRGDWKGRGVGWMLMQQLVDMVRASGVGALSGLVLRANTNMLQFCRDLGFAISASADDPLSVQASLKFH